MMGDPCLFSEQESNFKMERGSFQVLTKTRTWLDEIGHGRVLVPEWKKNQAAEGSVEAVAVSRSWGVRMKKRFFLKKNN